MTVPVTSTPDAATASAQKVQPVGRTSTLRPPSRNLSQNHLPCKFTSQGDNVVADSSGWGLGMVSIFPARIRSSQAQWSTKPWAVPSHAGWFVLNVIAGTGRRLFQAIERPDEDHSNYHTASKAARSNSFSTLIISMLSLYSRILSR